MSAFVIKVLWKEFFIKCLPLFCPCIILFLILKGSTMLSFSSVGLLSPVLFPATPSQPLFCIFYHRYGFCTGTACPARLSAASSLASLLLRGDNEEKSRMTRAPPHSPIPHKLAAEGEALPPSPAATPAGCYAFRG